jgi:S1-C subfamily serine protease
MDGTALFDLVKTGVAHIVVRRLGLRISSGSAFLVAGKVLTCAHVLSGFGPADEVQVRYAYPDQQGGNDSFTFRFGELHLYSRGFSGEHSHDYLVLDLPASTAHRHQFTFASDNPIIGEPVAILGYPFEAENLTFHQGHVSSLFQSGVAEMIQLDMSVNASNSGGPLVRYQDACVYGMVARKATGLSDAFDELMASFNENLRVLESVTGVSINMGGIDIMEVFHMTQAQMRSVALQIRRSANVGIGYAVQSTVLAQEPALN